MYALAALAPGVVVGCAVHEREAAVADTGPSAACATCHAGEARQAREFKHHHDAGDRLGCLMCHLPHAEVESALEAAGGLGPSGLGARCEDCHAEVQAEFALPFRHPLGASVSCTSCHPPHGGLDDLEEIHLRPSRRELREHLRREACADCHVLEARDYLFEHEGDRNLGCLSCHEPHGSSNRRLLTHADSRSLCHSCHSNLEDIHVDNPGSIFRNCLECHTEIHGSNWNSEFLR